MPASYAQLVQMNTLLWRYMRVPNGVLLRWSNNFKTFRKQLLSKNRMGHLYNSALTPVLTGNMSTAMHSLISRRAESFADLYRCLSPSTSLLQRTTDTVHWRWIQSLRGRNFLNPLWSITSPRSIFNNTNIYLDSAEPTADIYFCCVTSLVSKPN